MAYQELANSMDVPEAPDQTGGWSKPYVYHGQNISWTVCTRRGSVILRVERLTQEMVRNFDANKEALRLR